MKSIDEVVVRIELDNLISKGTELESYYNKGRAVFEALKKNRWIDENGQVLFHFRMDEVRCLPKTNGKYETIFRYYLVNN